MVLDERIIRAIERALDDGKTVEVKREFDDRRNRTGGRVLVVETTRRVTTVVADISE